MWIIHQALLYLRKYAFGMQFAHEICDSIAYFKESNEFLEA